MNPPHTDLAWRVGGPQGQGVDTAAVLFARACIMGGLHVFGRREYYSNIMGRHSYYDVRVAHYEITCHRDTVDLLTTFDSETLVRHLLAVVPGGGVIYDINDDDVPFARVTFLDQRFQEALGAYLDARNLPHSSAGLLKDARQRGINVCAIPYRDLTHALADDLQVPSATAERTLNTLAVALSCAILGYDRAYLLKALAKTFQGRQDIINLNTRAIELAYDLIRERLDLGRFAFSMEPQDTVMPQLFVNGNQAVALGKLAAGMTLQTYYPISPATDESTYLEAHNTFPTHTGDKGSVVVVQTEDELAAINMAAGAALTGARSATATSGPGFSLMAEGLGWAGMNEVPLVVTLYQRGGPSTGMPTRTEQGELLFAIRAGHSETPRLVLASGDLTEAFYDAAQAFNYAERYQTVVIHLLDKALASTTQTIPPFALDTIRIERGELYVPDNGNAAAQTFKRFAITDSGISPRALLGQPGGMHWLTGGEHTEVGLVTEDAGVREFMMEKRARKLALAARQIPVAEKFAVYGDPQAPLTVISWGSTKGGLLEAMQRLTEVGIGVRLIQIRLLWPFPAEELMPLLDTANPLVTVEANFSGQLAQLVREQTGREADYRVVKYNGRPMAGAELTRALTDIHAGTDDRRIVLRHPYE
jgi:2-oxoglutarate ferredoxin oxidoreductase subunit alpha